MVNIESEISEDINKKISIKINKAIDGLTRFRDELKNEEKKNIMKARLFSRFKSKEVNEFINNDICPPIFYMVDQALAMKVKEFKSYTLIESVDQIILSKEIEKYYLSSMIFWKKKKQR